VSNFFAFTMEHVRLTALRVLAEAPAYRANDSVLAQAIDAMGLPCTRDQLRGQLAWLEEQGLVRLDHPTPTLTVAIATERGCDVAHGRAIQPGVQRPSPGA
jgi:hypothetical protein